MQVAWHRYTVRQLAGNDSCSPVRDLLADTTSFGDGIEDDVGEHFRLLHATGEVDLAGLKAFTARDTSVSIVRVMWFLFQVVPPFVVSD
ncbi:hypothetical protein AMK34_11020 [Amycolatopsis sp. CB00013]|nr:hypothetical protein AMK34_11020 [Amycolatopsis sp. CB00013]